MSATVAALPSTGGGGSGSHSGVDPAITSWAQLAAIVTLGVAVPVVKVWIDASVSPPSLRVTQLRAGTDATDTSSGIQRPGDYNAATNAVVWYQTN